MGDQQVAVIGLGYVGLPLALLADTVGYPTIGVDIDETKIAQLQRDVSYIDDVSNKAIQQSNITFTGEAQTVTEASIVVVCVPTPVTHSKMPDLGPLQGALDLIAPHLQPGVLLVIESTINPGVCDEVLIPQIEEANNWRVGVDFDLVHCPERVNPGDPKWDVSNINRVIGGSTPEALQRGLEFYRRLLDAEIKPMGSLKEAEAVKVVENSFRDINIAFVNELAMAFHKLGIDLENVIDGAATKPFAFMPHHPGCGVGGHCIPVDPYYLIEYSRRSGFDHRFLSLARSINDSMPHFTVELLEEALAAHNAKLKGARVALLGLSYKANVGDDRESPAYEIRELLAKKGAVLTVFDPYIPGKSTVSTLAAALKEAEYLVLAAAHDEFVNLRPADLKKYGIRAVIDGRNMWRDRKHDLKNVGIAYKGIGQS